MHAAAQLFLNPPKPRPHAIASCSALELERSSPGRAADEREPQERKGLRSAKSAPLSAYSRVAAELQQSRLLPVQLEPESLEPRTHRIPEAPRIGFVLEANNDVIGISHDDHVAGGLSPSLTLMAALSGVEMGLKLAGIPLAGSGVSAAMEFFAGTPASALRT